MLSNDINIDQQTLRGPLAVFDSGYGGLTILDGIRRVMPQYDFVYFGDNARAPYGTRSFDIVYEFTLDAVRRLFAMGSPLIILGCNTASAKALRNIQQNWLPQHYPDRRVLGVIRPTAEIISDHTRSRHVGILATEGTIRSDSYRLEIQKLSPDITVTGVACPMWVPLVENGEYDKHSADYFVSERINHLLTLDPQIDAIILGCTHYPLLLDKIRRFCPDNIEIISQGSYIADSLLDYLHRHPDMDARLSRNGTCRYFTSESPERFKEQAAMFISQDVLEVQRMP